MKRVFRWLLGLFLALLVLVLVTVVAFGVAAVQKHPLVESNASNQLDGADSVNALLSQLNSAFSEREEGHTIVLSEMQIESLVGVLQRAAPNFRGVVNVTRFGGTVAFTFSPNNYDIYINVSALILPGDALKIDTITLGDLSLPGNMVVGFVETAINVWTRSKIASLALSRIEAVSMRENEVSLQIGPLDELLVELNTVSNNLSIDANNELQDLTAYYLRYISGRELALSPKPMPLIEYLREGMARARERSETAEEAVLHNKAVIFALAALVGHHRVGHLVGDIQPNPDKAIKPRAPAILVERNDLARHFIISAALELLGEQGVSLAIGEFKELMDRAQGGTGYSFVDLAADMAGAEFARVARSPDRAKELQNAMARVQSDSDIMPAIEGLPEGLSKQGFIQQYQQVDSELYLQEVKEIKRRLATITLYAAD